MTANGNAAPGTDFLDSLMASLRAAFAFMTKIVVAGLLVMAAGILAVATFVIGLLIAGVALLLRFTGWGRVRAAQRSSSDWREGEPVTLDARRTSHGWTVEQ